MTFGGLATAFAAGLLSFLSPCVLPLVPGYLSFMSGVTLEELSQGADRSQARRRAFLCAVFFGLGFSAVFTAMGASATALGELLVAHLGLLTKIAGAVIVAFGLHAAGVTPIRWLYYEKRFSAHAAPPGYGGAFLVGLAFACGWTPCIGPILAGILAIAATEKTVWQGVVLLGAYSAGLGVPFLATALAVNSFLRFFARYKRHIVWGERAAGALLVAVGTLIFFNRLTFINRYLPSPRWQTSLESSLPAPR